MRSAWRLVASAGCACCVVTSAVATSQKTSTPESISARLAIPRPGPTKSGVWTGVVLRGRGASRPEMTESSLPGLLRIATNWCTGEVAGSTQVMGIADFIGTLS